MFCVLETHDLIMISPISVPPSYRDLKFKNGGDMKCQNISVLYPVCQVIELNGINRRSDPKESLYTAHIMTSEESQQITSVGSAHFWNICSLIFCCVLTGNFFSSFWASGVIQWLMNLTSIDDRWIPIGFCHWYAYSFVGDRCKIAGLRTTHSHIPDTKETLAGHIRP